MDDLAYRQLEEHKIYKVNQAKIRQDILNIVHGNIRYADPFDKKNL